MNSEKLWNNKTRLLSLLLAVMLLLLSGCNNTQPSEPGISEGAASPKETSLPASSEPLSEKAASEPRNTEVQSTEIQGTEGSNTEVPSMETHSTEAHNTESPGTEAETEGENDRMFYAHVNGKVLKILAAENSSADAFLALLKTGDVTIEMHDYGSFEKVGSLGTTLPRNDEPITTEPGDVILYQGNQITIYYDINSWSFTRLGKVQDLSQAELKEILGTGDASVTFSLSEGRGQTGQFDFEKQTVLLNSGYEMPIIGLGTWTLKGEEAESSVYHALKSGMRLIDTARYYANEAAVGRGLRKAMDEGIVTREEVFITSKIYGGNYERAGGIIDDALKDLNVDYIDLMLIHQPGYDDEGVYKAMEEAVAAGKLRSIGISNYYTKEQVDEVLSFATIVPAVIQNENHLYYQNTELQEYVSQYGIIIESWYPFGGRGHTAEHFGNGVITELADKYGKTSAQIILRWHLQAGFIAIPGSSNPEHIAENYDIFDFKLSEEDMQRIRELDQQERYEIW